MMAISRVIVDTDEDDDGISSCADSPERTMAVEQLCDSEGKGASLQTSSTGASSTDAIVFKAVYKEHLGMTPLRSDELRNSYQSPTDQNSVSHPAMSSSTASDRRLKRSRTMNTSSLSSISEHSESGRKAKRAKSMKDLDDLPQVTTLNKSRYPTEKDPWEFPESSISEGSKNTVNAVILKAYERLQRTHTTIDGMRENSGHKPRPLVADEVNQLSDQTPRSLTDNDFSNTKLKKIRRTVSARAHEPDSSRQMPSESLAQKTTVSQDVAGSESTESPNVQIRCSTAQTHSPPPILSSPARSVDEEVGGSLIQMRKEAAILDPHPTIHSSRVQRSESGRNSVVIIPSILTEKQKLQYSVINVTSSGQSQHSPSEKADCIEPNSTYLGGKFSELDETQELAGQTLTSAILLSPSPQIPSTSRRMKRARSEVGTRQSMPSVILESTSKITKRRGRSKTTVLEEVLQDGAFVDELSLSPVQAFVAAACKVQAPMKDENKKNIGVSHQRTTTIEILNQRLMQQEEELDGARGSLRGTVSNKGAIESGEKSHQKEAPNSSGNSPRGPIDTLIEPNALPSIIPNQPKKRGRKKTSEMTASKAKDMTQAPNLEPMHKAPSTEPLSALREANHNIRASLPSKDQTSTPATKITTVGINPSKMLADSTTGTTTTTAPASTPDRSKPNPKAVAPPQTPTKDRENDGEGEGETKKQTSAQQHSPLQNGKVPYRVGLSRRKRIAPLLKIIRK